MPIYEFYCKECNTIYKFFSRSVNTKKVPTCPQCKNTALERGISLFATLSEKKGQTESYADPGSLNVTKMEKALPMLANEAGKIHEDDPRQAASFIRKLSEASGVRMGSGMEEALTRLEKGEDPDKIEREMGDAFEEEPFILESKGKKSSRKPEPKIDDALYEL